ncbi:MAG TPA: hypothetical protein ENJ79_08355 [Gammaproteobacteria bacterium]|nr:hypothetical protein [Gammaproteobacteria bacterium]
MKITKASPAVRFFFLFISSVIWLGIWQTGFSTAHWILYLPAVFLSFAAISGICPGLLLSDRLFPGKKSA